MHLHKQAPDLDTVLDFFSDDHIQGDAHISRSDLFSSSSSSNSNRNRNSSRSINPPGSESEEASDADEGDNIDNTHNAHANPSKDNRDRTQPPLFKYTAPFLRVRDEQSDYFSSGEACEDRDRDRDRDSDVGDSNISVAHSHSSQSLYVGRDRDCMLYVLCCS